MDNNDWKLKFFKRIKDFSVSIIFLCNKLPKTAAGFVIAQQLIKSSTSIGANVVEAQNTSSRKDFIQKMSISLREANETVY